MIDFILMLYISKLKTNTIYIYSDTDSFFYAIRPADIYGRMHANKQHLDVSESVREGLRANANNHFC